MLPFAIGPRHPADVRPNTVIRRKRSSLAALDHTDLIRLAKIEYENDVTPAVCLRH